jgi:hypothetical protein
LTQHRPRRAPKRPNLNSTSIIELPLDWSPDQALAVLEILDALRERLWLLYGIEIQHALRLEQSVPAPYTPSNIDDSDVPF